MPASLACPGRWPGSSTSSRSSASRWRAGWCSTTTFWRTLACSSIVCYLRETYTFYRSLGDRPDAKKSPVPRTKWSIQQLERYIRSTAADSNKVSFSDHAKTQMRKRRISIDTVFEVLRKGKILRRPEPNSTYGTLECRIEFYVSGEERKVVVAVSDEDENALVVTAF